MKHSTVAVYALTALHILNPNLELLSNKITNNNDKKKVTNDEEQNKPLFSIKPIQGFSYNRKVTGFVKNW